jgi:hypothetical protein
VQSVVAEDQLESSEVSAESAVESVEREAEEDGSGGGAAANAAGRGTRRAAGRGTRRGRRKEEETKLRRLGRGCRPSLELGGAGEWKESAPTLVM